MKLLTLILKQTELISDLNDELGEIGVKHGTIIDAKRANNDKESL